jgi:hypothetical protein
VIGDITAPVSANKIRVKLVWCDKHVLGFGPNTKRVDVRMLKEK